MFAAWIDISHPDIISHKLLIRSRAPTCVLQNEVKITTHVLLNIDKNS